MVHSAIAGEFIGRLGMLYKDGKTVYAYDEISHGLYKFELDLKEVNLIVPFVDAYWGAANRVRGISKNGNELIVLPSCLDSEWLFYNMEKGEVRYETPIKEKICISNAITMDKTLFLIPADIDSPITVVSLDNLKEVNLQKDWMDRNELRNGIYGIWGAASCTRMIVFPIVYSKQVILIKDKKASVIKVKISNPIFSVCIQGDSLWVLPVSGGYIYRIDHKGDILDKVYLSKEGTKVSASDFIRVIAAEGYIFLLSRYGGNLCAYQYRKNQIVQIKEEGARLQGGLFKQGSAQYWDYLIEDKVLHFLPCRSRYKTVDLSSFEVCEHMLWYGDNINPDAYWEMAADAQKGCVFNERKDVWDEFLAFMDYSSKGPALGRSVKIGKQIWGSME